MTRRGYIEQIRRLIYGGQPASDANISVGYINNAWLNQAIGVAAEKNYKDNYALDGIAYTNGSFYTTYSDLPIVKDEFSVFKITLPHIPIGLGNDEGFETCILTDSVQNTYPIVWMTQKQRGYQRGMRAIPNKILGYSEGKYIFFLSVFSLLTLTAKITMVSGGATDLDSTLNVPDNYFPVMTDYLTKNLSFALNVKIDDTADGRDVNPSA
jgi:hypothetical protein